MMWTRWGTEYSRLSPECKKQVNKFYMAQQELCQELLEAKPLGICKTTISGRNPLSSKSHILTTISGKRSIVNTITSRKGSKEMSF